MYKLNRHNFTPRMLYLFSTAHAEDRGRTLLGIFDHTENDVPVLEWSSEDNLRYHSMTLLPYAYKYVRMARTEEIYDFMYGYGRFDRERELIMRPNFGLGVRP